MLGVIDIKTINMGMNATTKEEVLKLVSDMAFEHEIVKSKEEYFEGLINRENEFTTGIGKGFAIPHCKSNTVNRPAVIVSKLNSEIDWQSMDEKPVNFVIALAVPESDAGTNHLKILSQVARCLMDDEFTDKLKEANSEDTIYNLLNEKIKGGK